MTNAKVLHLAIRPVDSFMFRDGRPFNQGDPGAAEATSVFPPFPPTVVGMVRAMLALEHGWDGKSEWDRDTIAKLGSGVNWQDKPQDIAPLAFSSPTVMRGGNPMFHAPRSLLVETDEMATSAGKVLPLKPQQPFRCDLGEATRLPMPTGDADDLKTPDGWWLPVSSLEKYLSGKTPAGISFNNEHALWQRELRIGVGINAIGVAGTGNLASRRPVDGALYAASHVRLSPDVSLAVSVTTTHAHGLALGAGRRLAPAGGEHRLAEIELLSSAPGIPKQPDLKDRQNENGKLQYLVYHAAPCLMRSLPEPGAALQGMPGKVVSGCLGKRQTIGGWDTIGKRPIPMRAAIPAGSVWFMETEPRKAQDVIEMHGQRIGEATSWGFGQIFIGTW